MHEQSAAVGSDAQMMWLKRLFIGALFAYALVYVFNPDKFGLLDNVDLAIHETGHLVFTPFGEFLHFLGGTLFQLIVPIAFVLYFRRQRNLFAASVMLWWVAQNCWNIARYVADARARELPLVGGGEHDWTYLLLELNLLPHDQTIATVVQIVGFLIFAASIWFAWVHSAGSVPAAESATTDWSAGR